MYTDLSCWDIDDPRASFSDLLSDKRHAHLRKKILFGTGWYMTLLALNGKSYKEFCEEFWKLFQQIPDGRQLWERFTFVNPFAFYGIFDKTTDRKAGKLDNLYSAPKKARCNKTKLDRNCQSIRLVRKYYEQIRGN